MDMKSGIAPIVPSYHPSMSQRVLCKHAVLKSAHPNTVHAEKSVSLAVLIANANMSRQSSMNSHCNIQTHLVEAFKVFESNALFRVRVTVPYFFNQGFIRVCCIL